MGNECDQQGRLVSIQSPEGIVSYAFNDLGRMTAKMVGLASNPIRRTSYSYDALDRLAYVEEDLTPSNTNDPTLETDYHYNLEGNLVRTKLPSGNIEAIDYDSLGRVIGITDYDSKGTETVADDTKVAEYDYTLRADGRKVQSVEKFWKGSDANPFVTNTLDYEYDGLNRLTCETLDSTDNALDYRDDYVFDLTGNRLQKKHDVGSDGTIDRTTTSNFDASDRLLSEIIDQL